MPCPTHRLKSIELHNNDLVTMTTPQNTPIQAIIFDLDGTLVDSETPGLDVLHESLFQYNSSNPLPAHAGELSCGMHAHVRAYAMIVYIHV